VQKARTFFRVELEFFRRHLGEEGRGEFGVRVALPGRPAVELSLARRPAREDDWRAAEEAERAGQAAGMAFLARRCPVVWEIRDDAAHPGEILTLCGILAAAELGPVMPPDRSTLYGVRGARLRAESFLQGDP
jgi:hypothetical protein